MFIAYPSRLAGSPVNGFLVDAAAKLRGFHSPLVGAWVIVDTDHPTPSLETGLGTLALGSGLYNGEPYWAGDGGAVFKSVAQSWICRTGAVLDEPHAERDVDGTTWFGDGWWRLMNLPSDAYPETTVTPCGTYQNEGSADASLVTSVKFVWPRWERNAGLSSRSTAPCGVYEGKDGAEDITPKRILGSAQFQDADRGLWTKSGKIYVSSRGRVLHEDEYAKKWIVGVRGAGLWWEGEAAPTVESGGTYAPMKLDPDTGDPVVDPDRAPITLTFYRCVATEGMATCYMAEVAQWR